MSKKINEESGTKKAENKNHIKRMTLGIFYHLIILILVLIIAGRVSYWQGWIFVIYYVIVFISHSLLLRNNTSLIEEREKPGSDIKKWDKNLIKLCLTPATIILVLVAILDAGRFQWTPESYKLYLYLIGHPLIILSFIIFTRAMLVNNFFSRYVRVQHDRNHKVIKEGPYRLIRHPGHLSGIFLAIGSSFVLGSLYGLIPACFITIMIIIRTSLEDKTLKNELPGYKNYSKEVKYRLVPGIW